jgi:hypothetical protein
MSVGRADANGAGSVSPPVPAPTTSDTAADAKGMPKAGLADGANTTWSTARKSVQVAEAPKRSAALDFKAIDKAVDNLAIAHLSFLVADRNYEMEKNGETRAERDNAKDLYCKSQFDLGMVVENQTKRARDSSLYKPGYGLKNSGHVRQLEHKILDHPQKPLLKSYLAEAINDNRGLRAPGELKALSVRMHSQASKGVLSSAEQIEAANIIDDATDAVMGQHWDETGRSPDALTTGRLRRFDRLLDAATTPSEDIEKLDLDLYDQVTSNIRSKMYPPGADSTAFDKIVATYRARLTQ